MLYYLRIRRCYHYSDYEIEEFLGAKGSFSERIHMRCPRIEETRPMPGSSPADSGPRWDMVSKDSHLFPIIFP